MTVKAADKPKPKPLTDDEVEALRRKGVRIIEPEAPVPLMRPTKQQIARADHFDPGDPLNSDKTHKREQRLGTAWDRYCHPAKDGKSTLEVAQIQAGNHYMKDYSKAAYDSVPVGKFEPSVDGGGREENTYIWAARDRVTKAQRLLRPHEIALLHAVLFERTSAKEWAQANGRPSRSGLTYLKDILDVLAVHWGYSKKRRDLDGVHPKR